MIPHVAHFFWANRTMSWLRYLTLASFRHYHPDWHMQLHRYVLPPAASKPWETLEVQEFHEPAEVRDYWPRVAELDVEVRDWQPPCPVMSPVHASDLFQWEILSTVGGLYCDMDILFTGPVLRSLSDEPDMYVCLWRDACAIGFLAAAPGNPFFADVLKRAIAAQSHAYQSAGCEAVIGVIERYAEHQPEPCCEKARLYAIGKRHAHYRCLNLPRTVVYPFWWDRVSEIFTVRHTTLPAATVGIHWYAGSPLSQQHNRLMHDANFRTFPCTFSHFAMPVVDHA